MKLSIEIINKQFSNKDICNEIEQFIKNNKTKKQEFSISRNRALDFLFYCLLTDENYNNYKEIKGGGTSDWSGNAQIDRFLNNSSDYGNIVFDGNLFKNQDDLDTVKNEIPKIVFTKDEKQCYLDNNQIKVLQLLIDELLNHKGVRKMEKNINDIIKNSIENNKQIIFTGAPGTGKTYSVREYVKERCAILDKNGKKQYIDEKLKADEAQYKFVQFHPSYDYSDFVEGLRPVVLKGKEEPTFVRMDGVFKEFCRHIVNENQSSKKYYFIVDEINRADLAKVFGELMFGLEESYRGKDNPIQTQYKNLVTYRIITQKDAKESPLLEGEIGKAEPIGNDVFEDGFYIPENLVFIGTMNDIDRSVDSIDFALRRRFQWIDVEANEIMKSSLHSILDEGNVDETSDVYKKIDYLADRIIKMNEAITNSNEYEFGLSEAYHIGPAYFKKLDINNEKSLEEIFDTNIVSILKEYTRGRKQVDTWISRCRNALLGDN